jgi:hypothetical protein
LNTFYILALCMKSIHMGQMIFVHTLMLSNIEYEYVYNMCINITSTYGMGLIELCYLIFTHNLYTLYTHLQWVWDPHMWDRSHMYKFHTHVCVQIETCYLYTHFCTRFVHILSFSLSLFSFNIRSLVIV